MLTFIFVQIASIIKPYQDQ